MKYSGFYFHIFYGPMKQVLREHCGPARAQEIMKKSKGVYRELVEGVPDLGKGNPMAYNVLFTLSFVAPYVASEKEIPVETVQEMMRRGLEHVRWFFSRTDLNTEKGKAANRSIILRYLKWYTPERQALYPASYTADLEGLPYEGACYWRITRCPVSDYCKQIGVEELTGLLCELDHIWVGMQHGILHRNYTLGSGGPYCDFFMTGDREEPKN